jgi:hypothetical protein
MPLLQRVVRASVVLVPVGADPVVKREAEERLPVARSAPVGLVAAPARLPQSAQNPSRIRPGQFGVARQRCATGVPTPAINPAAGT